MNPTSVRQLSGADAAEYAELRLQALRDSPTAFASSYEEERLVTPAGWRERLIGTADKASYGAYIGPQLAGIATLVREQKLKQRHKANIYAVYVAPEQRGQGLARALMEAVVAHARTMDGVRQLLLTVTDGNAQAQQLYASLGFMTYGREPDALMIDGRRYAEVLMCKPLAPY
ncbi:GNAT family N-acetyltransferase [Bordetella genomosp. 5]|uniref:GNAT family N-acetyltransferase n=1 Tax=Bordetella genomosp. 5 TaxID=1395608 RepID=UPI000B9EDC32|nr:GNAT family N-acetyltransferase [Bordetella genomosp. 5]OZI38816.1 GNAT family N-acetyltransferase [Bordetella genomosp. 5]